MKHEIKSKKPLDSHNFKVSVQLFPEDLKEVMAIKSLETFDATPQQKELIENYLNFQLNLGNYSVVDFIEQKGELFELKIFI